jgi:C4-dicarboxylate transporter DctQ subunit
MDDHLPDGGGHVIIFAAVVHRYGPGLPIPGLQDWLLQLNFGWAQELCIIMFVWMAKFGAAYGVRTGIHVGVDVLINKLNLRARHVHPLRPAAPARCSPASSAHWARIFVWENGAHYASFIALGLDTGDLSRARPRPTSNGRPGSSTAAVPLGSALMCFRFLQVPGGLQAHR